MHSDGRPVTHISQLPQKTVKKVMTWSPGFRCATSLPTASTTPAASCPGTVGTGCGKAPSTKCRSERQTPHATVRISTSRGPGVETRTSVIWSGVLASKRTAAFILPFRHPPRKRGPISHRSAQLHSQEMGR